MAGLLKEVWLTQLMEKFYPKGDFMNFSQDMSPWVENNTINLADAGVDPDVLEDNTSYPVSSAERTDSALALPLMTLDTTSTIVRNAKNVELSYNKMESVLRGHRAALLNHQRRRASYSWAPASNTANTPILESTGALASGFRDLTYDDLIDAQKALDDIDCPTEGRIMTINSSAKQALMKEDKELFKSFANLKAGEVGDFAGFKIMFYNNNVLYTSANAKRAFGSAYAATNKKVLAQFWLESEVMRAVGTTELFDRLRDPDARGDIVGFQQRFVALPIRNKALGTIITATS